MSNEAAADAQNQSPEPLRRSGWSFQHAENSLREELSARSLVPHPVESLDRSDPLHVLWLDARAQLDRLFSPTAARDGRAIDVQRLTNFVRSIYRRTDTAVKVYMSGGVYRAHLPQRAEFLALRFALPMGQNSREIEAIMSLLTRCYSVHLLQVADRDPRALLETWESAERLLHQRGEHLNEAVRLNKEACERNDMLLRVQSQQLEEINKNYEVLREQSSAVGTAWTELMDGLDAVATAHRNWEAARLEWQELTRRQQAMEQLDSPPTSPTEGSELE
ncbi:hypothetical protein PWT90_04732 [Aphanocladium album]|nr:hypothetical protein PWT90_04732 [Aphanocladium album]